MPPYIVVMTMRDSYLVPKSKKGIEDINNTSIRIVKMKGSTTMNYTILFDSSCTPFFPSNYNPNDPEFTGEYEGPAYDFNSDDIPF